MSRVVVVTGGAGGIGRAVVEAFESLGDTVYILDRVAPAGGAAATIECDVSSSAAVDAAFATILEQARRVDVLANVAGVDDPAAKARIAASTGGRIDVTATLTDEQWHGLISINLDGVFFTMRAALRAMSEQLAGVIVNISSIAGVAGHAGYPHYSAAKAAVLGLTRAVAKEMAPYGVRVNAIAPGPVSTPMAARTEALGMSLPTPLGRSTSPAEIAAAVVFLASAGAATITGETLNVNGGLLTI